METGRWKGSQVHEGNRLHAQAKGKTHKGAEEKKASGDLLSNYKPKQTAGWSKRVQQSASCSSPPPLLVTWTASRVLATGSRATACAS